MQKKPNKGDKLYVVQKFIWAANAQEALSHDKEVDPDECWVDPKFKEGMTNLADPIGFKFEPE